MEHLVKSLKALDLDGNTLVVQKQAYSSQSFGQSLCCLLSSHFFNTQKIIVNSALLLKTSSGKSLMVTAKVSTLPSKESKQLVFESVLLSSLVDIILDTKLCEAFDITENQKISITPISNEECLEIFAPALKVSIRLLSMKSNNGRDRFLAPITTFLCELQYIFSRQIYYMPGLDVQFEIISIKSASSGVLLSAKFSSKSKLGFEEGSNLQLAPSGLESQFDEIKQTIEFPLAKLSFFEMYQLRFPRGILLYGPPGTGKTMLARIVASSLNLYSIVVDGASLSNKYFGESEAYLRNLFKEAEINAPSLIFIDEIDSSCPRRDSTNVGSLESRIVTTLLTLLDGVSEGSKAVFVLAATNSINSIDPALRRPGRFDKEIEIGIPSAEIRCSILEAQLQGTSHLLCRKMIEDVASKTNGFVGSDLSLLVKEAILVMLSKGDGAQALTFSDFSKALSFVKPSALREICLEIPKVKWSDIAGQAETKRKLKESVELPLRHPEKFLRMGISPPKGILLYGPPGCSKTLLAKALAYESGLNFMAVKGPEVFSKWVGDSEKTIKEIFRKARTTSPSIIFFDEFDAVGAKRSSSSSQTVNDRVLSQILCEMDGIDPLVGVTIIAATNRPDIIDEALMRPGRFDRHIYVKLPDFPARLQIFEMQSKAMPFSDDIGMEILAEKTTGYSGAEIVQLCQEAAYLALSEDLDWVCLSHLLQALENNPPRMSKEQLQFFDNFERSKL